MFVALGSFEILLILVILAALGLGITWLITVGLPRHRAGSEKKLEEVIPLDETWLASTRTSLDHLKLVQERTAARLEATVPDVPDLLDYIIVQSHNMGASDIHVTPMPSTINVEIRLDGLLYDIAQIPNTYQDALIRRVKILASLDLFARDVPQDGHISEVAGQQVDIRLSTLPVAHGDKSVLRLLSAAGGLLDLHQLSLVDDMLLRFREVCDKPQGMVVLTGPTGSGKTTTIYGALREIKDRRSASVNVVTIENPVETEIPALSQTEVNEKTGLTFAKGLRSMMRQDPDVIMVGEIRDAETAAIAVQAGMTGHLIFTSIHANSSAGVFNRLITMGVEPFLVASSVVAILSQRLIRRLCPHCRQPTGVSEYHQKQLERLGVKLAEDEGFWMAAGCKKCLGKGSEGRIGLFELLLVDDKIRNELVKEVPTHLLQTVAREQGLPTLLDDGLAKARKGDCSLEEVLRVVV